jgi:hypothetical protein
MRDAILDKWLHKDHLFALLIADTHIMHMCGLAPVDGWVTHTGNVLQPNTAQEYLGECWAHFLDRIPKRFDYLFLAGDIIEGQNKFDQARELCEVDPEFQVRAAEEVIGPLAERAANTIMVAGSDYHEGRGSTGAEALGKALGAVKKGPHYAPPWRVIVINDKVEIDLGHRQSFTIRYAATPMEREIGFALERSARARKLLPECYVVVRAHTHRGFRVLREHRQLSISVPCWKIQDIYAQKSISPNRLVPDNLGAIGLKIYNEPKEGKLVHTIPYLYEHPEDPPERL